MAQNGAVSMKKSQIFGWKKGKKIWSRGRGLMRGGRGFVVTMTSLHCGCGQERKWWLRGVVMGRDQIWAGSTGGGRGLNGGRGHRDGGKGVPS